MELNDFDGMIGELDGLASEETRRFIETMLDLKSEADLLKNKARGLKIGSSELTSELQFGIIRLKAELTDLRAEAAQRRSNAAQLRADKAQNRSNTVQAEADRICA